VSNSEEHETNVDVQIPPTAAAGVCVWLTGLSGSGKTTIAAGIGEALAARGTAVTVLDGDDVRRRLFPGLGFDRADRDRNVVGVARLAGEIVARGGVAICALISPYRAARAQARSIVGPRHFVEVFVDAPIEVCESRDTKDLYRRARDGSLRGMTGVDDPYEPPTDPDLVLDTVAASVDENVAAVVRVLAARGLTQE
jgi:sulfate adenylyltransferase